MGRSVSTPSAAFTAAYTHVEPEDFDWFDAWDEYCEDLRDYVCRDVFKTMTPCDQWIGREDRALAENDFAYFGVSEYCGLVAIWLAEKDVEPPMVGLASRWRDVAANKLQEKFGTLRKVAVASNGEALYERIQ